MAQASKKIKERRSNWYGHVMRRDANTEDGAEEGCTGEKEERMTENKMGRRVPTRHEKTESGRDK